MQSTPVDGMYAIYYQGAASPGLALVEIAAGRITGADVSGGIWDGEFEIDPAKAIILCKVSIELPRGGLLATTGQLPIGDQAREMRFTLPIDFSVQPYVSLSLPIGTINVRFQKVR